MNVGTVKWFNTEKGYGFILTESGNDVFVHFKAIKTEGYKVLEEGQTVMFDTETDHKGTKAVNVKVVESVME